MHSMHNNDMQIDSYLASIARRLKSLPPEMRNQELAEARLHISEMVEANVELGKSREEAVTESLRQFGNPSDIGKQLARSWRRGVERRLPGTLGSAIAWCGVASLITFAVHMVVNLWVPYSYAPHQSPVLAIIKAYGFGLSLSFLDAYLGGIKAPRFAMQGAAVVWAMWLSLGLAVFFALSARNVPSYAHAIIFFSYLLSASLSLSAHLLGAYVGRRRFVSQYLQTHRA